MIGGCHDDLAGGRLAHEIRDSLLRKHSRGFLGLMLATELDKGRFQLLAQCVKFASVFDKLGDATIAVGHGIRPPLLHIFH